LGVGSDGHTAGIFPLNEESFINTYEADPTYAPVHLETLTIDSRASFSSDFILNECDAAIGYVVGESKHAILQSLQNETKPIHERSAEILKRHRDSTVYTNQPVLMSQRVILRRYARRITISFATYKPLA
jgi:6-phosphogluconolactonase/glucosamine-6-phosphate isomerase/deaminase